MAASGPHGVQVLCKRVILLALGFVCVGCWNGQNFQAHSHLAINRLAWDSSGGS